MHRPSDDVKAAAPPRTRAFDVNTVTNAAPTLERPARPAPDTRAGIRRQRRRTFTFWMLMVFFVLEYVRPEPIVQLKLQMLTLLVFPLMWLAEPRRPWSRNLTLQAIFLGLCALSVTFAENYFSAYITARGVYGNLVIALAITWLLTNLRDFRFAIWFWVLVMTYQVFYGVTHGGRGSGGFLGDENDLALGLNTALPFAFMGMLKLRGWKSWGCGVLVVLFITGIVVSISRGGFIGMVAVIGYCIAMGRNPIRNFSIVAVGALIFFLAIPASYKKEIISIGDTGSGTAEIRRFFWAAARNMWKDNPVLGVGAGNSNWNIGRYQPREKGRDGLFSGDEFAARDYTSQSVHSVFFQVLSEMGTVGSVVFGMIVIGHYQGLREVRRHVKRDPRSSRRLRNETELYVVALGGAMTGYLAAGAFLSVAYYPYPYYFGAFTVAYTRAVNAQLSARRSA